MNIIATSLVEVSNSIGAPDKKSVSPYIGNPYINMNNHQKPRTWHFF
jgi:hypothetical protein